MSRTNSGSQDHDDGNSIRITKLHVEHFRQMEDLELPIGDRITLIAGQNGTAKSTILGMICQPFSFGTPRGKSANKEDASVYTKNYHGQNLNEHRTLLDTRYAFDCDDVFRLSKKYDYKEDGDKNGYRYRIFLEGESINQNPNIVENGLLIKQRMSRRKDGRPRTRFVTGPETSHEKGEGNFPHPVIYLGLNRLFPLAQCKDVMGKAKTDLSNEEELWYVEQYADILLLRDERNNDVEHAHISGKAKNNYIGPVSNNYDTESCSAGQDNLGQVLTAILSFRQLKEKLGSKYQGGLLVIDEIDTSLHAFALEKLVKMLIQQCSELNLQIIATTHSLQLLKLAYESEIRPKIEVLALRKRSGRVEIMGSSSYEELENNLSANATPNKKITRKITVLCEDGVSKNFLVALVGSKYFKIRANGTSGDTIASLAGIGLDELKSVIFVPDGDIKNKTKKHPNLVFLPGKTSPEQLLYDFLNNLNEEDQFWEKSSPGYSFQAAFKNYWNLTKKPEKRQLKAWYKSQKKYWKNELDVFKYWTKDHQNRKICDQFCKDLVKAIRSVAPGIIHDDPLKELENRFSPSKNQ